MTIRIRSAATLALIVLLGALIACGTPTRNSSLDPEIDASGEIGSPLTQGSDPPGLDSAAPSAVDVDTSLLDLLPDEVGGLARENQREADETMAMDPVLGTFATAVSTAFYAGPASTETVQAIVARLRGTPTEAVLRGWRTAHGRDICAEPGGVATEEQTAIGGRETIVVRCLGDQAVVYFVLLIDRGVLLTVDSFGAGDIGRKLLESLRL
jgi:hypothetical protein